MGQGKGQNPHVTIRTIYRHRPQTLPLHFDFTYKAEIINKTVTAYGDRKVISYSFNDVYAEWKLSPSTVTKVKGQVVTIQGDRLSPSTVTVLSPSTAHSIDKERNITKESGEAPLGPPERVQGLSLPTEKDLIYSPGVARLAQECFRSVGAL